jgi:hypothetical protein
VGLTTQLHSAARGFRRVSAIPVKFTVCDANGNAISDMNAVFAGTSGQVTLTGAVWGQIQTVNEQTSYDTPDSGFRWSSSIWIFNMATNNLQKNQTYTFRINLKDGSNITFTIGTK